MPWGVAAAAVVGAVGSSMAASKGAKASARATDSSAALTRETNAMTERLANESKQDANRLFGQQEHNARAGMESAKQLFDNTLPAQFEQQQAGNMAAQNMLAGSLPQQNNAILGSAPVDYNQYQPQQMPGVDMSMFNVDLPDYRFLDGTTTNVADQPVMNSPTMSNQDLLAGRGGYGDEYDRYLRTRRGRT